MKYYLVLSGIDCNQTNEDHGILAWAKTFGGELIAPEYLKANLQSAVNSTLHFNASEASYKLIRLLRDHFQDKISNINLVISFDARMDISLKNPITPALIDCANFCFVSDNQTAKKIYNLYGYKLSVIQHPVVSLTTVSPVQTAIPKLAIMGTSSDFLELQSLLQQRTLLEIITSFDICYINTEIQTAISIREQLTGNQFLLYLPCENNHELELIFSASHGCIPIIRCSSKAVSRCSPYGKLSSIEDALKTLSWLTHDRDPYIFSYQQCLRKSAIFNHRNRGYRFKAYCKTIRSPSLNTLERALLDDIHLLSANEYISHLPEDVLLVSMIKNSMQFLPSFLDHYRRIGVDHFYLIDNGSVDDTVPYLLRQGDVTLYQTHLPYQFFHNEIRTEVILKHCYRRWFFCVDIDEHFVYPYMENIPFRYVINYLNKYKFNAVIANMLDMIKDSTKECDLENRYTFFDIRNIEKVSYFSAGGEYCLGNEVCEKELKAYIGGIRQFKLNPKNDSKFLLIKHPLMFLDELIEPLASSHFCDNANISDFTCLLKHYKLTDDLCERIQKTLDSGEYSYLVKEHLEAYRDNLKGIHEYSEILAQFQNTKQLIDLDFIMAPARYCQLNQKTNSE